MASTTTTDDGHVTEVRSEKECDICGKTAEYDGKTRMGPWAYMCERHFRKLGVGLGTGKGQKLEVVGDE